MNRIIYPNKNTISIIVPCSGINIDFIAKKDVPKGVPYKIISIDDIPTDRTFRNSWQYDFSNPDGYGEGEEYDNN